MPSKPLIGISHFLQLAPSNENVQTSDKILVYRGKTFQVIAKDTTLKSDKKVSTVRQLYHLHKHIRNTENSQEERQRLANVANQFQLKKGSWFRRFFSAIQNFFSGYGLTTSYGILTKIKDIGKTLGNPSPGQPKKPSENPNTETKKQAEDQPASESAQNQTEIPPKSDTKTITEPTTQDPESPSVPDVHSATETERPEETDQKEDEEVEAQSTETKESVKQAPSPTAEEQASIQQPVFSTEPSSTPSVASSASVEATNPQEIEAQHAQPEAVVEPSNAASLTKEATPAVQNRGEETREAESEVMHTPSLEAEPPTSPKDTRTEFVPSVPTEVVQPKAQQTLSATNKKPSVKELISSFSGSPTKSTQPVKTAQSPVARIKPQPTQTPPSTPHKALETEAIQSTSAPVNGSLAKKMASETKVATNTQSTVKTESPETKVVYPTSNPIGSPTKVMRIPTDGKEPQPIQVPAPINIDAAEDVEASETKVTQPTVNVIPDVKVEPQQIPNPTSTSMSSAQAENNTIHVEDESDASGTSVSKLEENEPVNGKATILRPPKRKSQMPLEAPPVPALPPIEGTLIQNAAPSPISANLEKVEFMQKSVALSKDFAFLSQKLTKSSKNNFKEKIKAFKIEDLGHYDALGFGKELPLASIQFIFETLSSSDNLKSFLKALLAKNSTMMAFYNVSQGALSLKFDEQVVYMRRILKHYYTKKAFQEMFIKSFTNDENTEFCKTFILACLDFKDEKRRAYYLQHLKDSGDLVIKVLKKDKFKKSLTPRRLEIFTAWTQETYLDNAAIQDAIKKLSPKKSK
ncbi:putative uncharacterized protein [Parachlamydia acanthamoebae UV-7]|uniref:Uncharacterized protein n=2 Tax=Parachlamydia acanthamoebae TaxID=83552 RepID=F8L2G9_PARAV|nr:hypothetical protein [Parachlamydia acanthamoebae]EFB40168.1 hypothetical protein pah_c253o024 [Parachlamydia acanthamoebae str. Hall's coccus]KIA76828.1 hypothetical protein DB43_HI00130 [Parachlamydia acanthamoebae]CCB87482.1 putative uncharacterized protein [Parachlamydia acanthamoebae UV-7]